MVFSNLSPSALVAITFSGILGKVGKRKEAVKNCLEMVRVTGLEPVRQRHTPLKRACLPIPAHSHIKFLSSRTQQEILYHRVVRMSTVFEKFFRKYKNGFFCT